MRRLASGAEQAEEAACRSTERSPAPRTSLLAWMPCFLRSASSSVIVLRRPCGAGVVVCGEGRGNSEQAMVREEAALVVNRVSERMALVVNECTG